jgi:hypothetical protein
VEKKNEGYFPGSHQKWWRILRDIHHVEIKNDKKKIKIIGSTR